MPSLPCKFIRERETAMIRTYSELKQLHTLEERFNYLKLQGRVGESTFGFDRYLNQMLYSSERWKRTRRGIIIRDNGCDLGVEGYEINDLIMVHHMNPITIEDIEEERDKIFNEEFLISASSKTHKAIHYGDERLLPKVPIIRYKNDTCPWRQ
jgi:hypothetical protein